MSLAGYGLAPLSAAAQRLAEAHGAKPVGAFGPAAAEGGDACMASRPLDLEWMAKQWAAHKQLGPYAERIATAGTYRLGETNPS